MEQNNKRSICFSPAMMTGKDFPCILHANGISSTPTLCILLVAVDIVVGCFPLAWRGGRLCALTYLGKHLNKEAYGGEAGAPPSLVMGFIQPWAHSHAELPFLRKASVPPLGRRPPLSGRCPVPQGGFWNVQFCWGTKIPTLLLGVLEVHLLPVRLLLLSGVGVFWVGRHTQTWENFEHTPRECWALCVLPKAI